MRAIVSVILAVIAALAVYAGVFLFVVEKSLTVGFIRDAFALKLDYARRIDRPKVVFVAGSSGLFSTSCAVMESILRRPCVNGAITAELGLEYTLEIARRLVRPGDVVVMPLEYPLYRGSEDQMRRARLHPFRLSYDRATLWRLPLGEIVSAIYQFDLRYLIVASVEMGLARAGVSRRFSRKTLTPNGDMRGHTAEKGAPYRAFIAHGPFGLPRAQNFRIDAVPRRILAAFNGWARRRGVTVIGTLPTTFDDRPVEDALMQRIAALFRADGQHFMALDNRHQYPRACFYDSQFHLNQACQARHSRRLAEALARLPTLVPSSPPTRR